MSSRSRAPPSTSGCVSANNFSVLVGSMRELIQVQSKECTIGMVTDALMTRVRFPHEYSLFLWQVQTPALTLQGVWIKLELTQLILAAGIRNGEVLRYDNNFSYGWVPPSPPPQLDQRQFVQVQPRLTARPSSTPTAVAMHQLPSFPAQPPKST